MSLRPLKELLARLEAPEGYDQLNGYMERHVGQHPLRKMTINEVLKLQEYARAVGSPSTAAGQYQILYKTLQWLVAEMKLKGSELFDAPMQDKMGLVLMQRRGLESFLRGDMPADVFADNLAKEWASLPVVTAQQGYHREVQPGESYYSGDKLNKSLVSPQEYLAVLRQVRGTTVPEARGGWEMFWSFVWPILLGQVRHLLTAGGGYLVGSGYVSNDEWTAIAGGALAAVGAIASVVQKFTNSR